MSPAEKIKLVSKALGLSIAIEATGWNTCGNVSRYRDHADKALQDFIFTGIVLAVELQDIIGYCPDLKKVSISLTEKMLRFIGTNTSMGTIVLLTPNLCAAFLSDNFRSESISMKAYSLVLENSIEWFFGPIERVKPRYTGRVSATLLPTLYDNINKGWREKLYNKPAYSLLRQIPYDPVAMEILSVFASTRRASRRLLSSTRRLDSRAVDDLFRYLASKYMDYTVYRKWGLNQALLCKEKCGKGERVGLERCSLGSISDLVSMSLFYYLLEKDGGRVN